MKDIENEGPLHELCKESTPEKLYGLRLHEGMYLEVPYCHVLRVPGGWVYNTLDNAGKTTVSTFVPFNNEFQPI